MNFINISSTKERIKKRYPMYCTTMKYLRVKLSAKVSIKGTVTSVIPIIMPMLIMSKG